MTNIQILDTGFNTSDRDGDANTGSDITNLTTYLTNAGAEISLNVKSIGLKSGTNLADEPNPSSDDAARVHFTSFNNRIFEIAFVIDITDTTQRGLFKEIAVLDRTSGVKLFFASTTSDTMKTIPEIFGRTDTRFHTPSSTDVREVDIGIPVIVGKVRGVNITQIASSKKLQITGRLTFEEELVIKV